MRAVGGGLEEPRSSASFIFQTGIDLLFCIAKKVMHDWVRPPRPKRDLETQATYGLQTWQRGLSAQRGIRAPSKFGHDPCPVKRGHVAAVKCCVRKTRFFRCPGRGFGTQQEKPEPSVGLNTAKGKPVLFSVFRSHIIVGVTVGVSEIFRGLEPQQG